MLQEYYIKGPASTLKVALFGSALPDVLLGALGSSALKNMQVNLLEWRSYNKICRISYKE
jgi:hypothetical protein